MELASPAGGHLEFERKQGGEGNFRYEICYLYIIDIHNGVHPLT